MQECMAAEVEAPLCKYGKLLPSFCFESRGPALAVEVRGRLLYTLSGNRLAIYDISRPLQPRFLGESAPVRNARQLVLREDGFAFVSARENGLWIIDVRNPAHPEVISRYDSVEMATGVEVDGNLIFLGNRVYGVEIVDGSDLRRPRHISLYRTPESQSVRKAGQLLFSGEWYAGEIRIADVRDPVCPREIACIRLDGYGDGIDLLGSLCFAATGHHAHSGPAAQRFGHGHGVEIFDVSIPESPKRLSVTKFPPLFHAYNDFWTPRAIPGGLLAVADTHNGVFLLSVARPETPRFLYRILLPEVPALGLADAVSCVAPGEGVLYLSGVTTGLHVAEVPGVVPRVHTEQSAAILPVVAARCRRPASTLPFRQYQPEYGQVREVELRGSVAFAACGQGGLQTVSLEESAMKLLRRWPIPCAYDVKLRQDLLFCAEGNEGLGIYRIDQPDALQPVGRLPLPVQKIWLPDEGHFLAASNRETELFLIDVADPAAPRLLLEHRQQGLLYGDLVSNGSCGGYMLANWHCGGFAWFRIDGREPEVGNLIPESLAAHTDGIAVFHNRMLILCNNRYAFLEANAAGPSSCWQLHPVHRGVLRGIPTVSGDLVCFAQRADGSVQLWDFHDRLDPRPIPERSFRLEGSPGRSCFFRNRLLIPAGCLGLLLENEQNVTHIS